MLPEEVCHTFYRQHKNLVYKFLQVNKFIKYFNFIENKKKKFIIVKGENFIICKKQKQ